MAQAIAHSPSLADFTLKEPLLKWHHRSCCVIIRVSFCCTKKLKKLQLFLTKVAFMLKHFKRQ